MTEEQLKRYQSILYRAATDLTALADSIRSKRDNAAARAVAGKLTAMARLRSIPIDDQELRLFRLRELMIHAWPEPSAWQVDRRILKKLSPNSYEPWRTNLRALLINKLGEEYRDELNYLLYLDEPSGPKRGLSGAEKRDRKAAARLPKGPKLQQIPPK